MKAAKNPVSALDADVAERGEPLDRQQRAGGEGHEPDDHHGAADDRQRTGTHADLGDQLQDRGRVVAQGVRGSTDGIAVEHRLPAEVFKNRSGAPTRRAARG